MVNHCRRKDVYKRQVLLRSLGIPARYAEGLIVTQADYDTPRDENGYLTITDQRAHCLLYTSHIDFIPVFLDDIHHVDSYNNWDTELCQLGGQVKISLQIGPVNDIENRIRTVIDQVISCDNLFERIGGQRVNSREVHNDHIIM